jgi:nucleoside-diphosphate-sugar epimerase
MQAQRNVLVLGANGNVGSEVTKQLRDAGWQVRAMTRDAARAAERHDGITWLQGDALEPADVEAAAEDCAVIVHAVNPPGYRNWSGLVLPMLENTIAAARSARATIVLPGNVYNYGPDAFPVLTEDAPQRPLTRKGAIRVAMEQRLRDYADDGGRVIVVRAGDYFGPNADGTWFSMGLVKPGRTVRTVNEPGMPGVGHQWAYLPDVARAMVRLLERRDSLEPFASFHLGGHWDDDGTKMTGAVSRVVAARTGKAPRVADFPWWLIRLLSPFTETLRELLEMKYLWRQPVRLDNARITRELGREPHTPLDQAIEETLQGLKCLP